VPRKGRKWNRTSAIYNESLDDIVRDFEGGADMKTLAYNYAVSAPTIKRWLKDLGYVHAKTGR
jgi:hypothetical protein